MKKTRRDKTGFHDWLLINTLKYRGDGTIPGGFTVSDEKRREAILYDPEAKLDLLAEVAKLKYPTADKLIGFSTFLLCISFLPIFLILYAFLGSGTLSGVETLANGDTAVNLGLFIIVITIQYIVLICCLILWIVYGFSYGLAFIFGRTDNHKPMRPFSLVSWLCNPIGTAVIATHWVITATLSMRKRDSISLVDFVEQYQNKPRVLQLLASTFAQIFWLTLALVTITLFVWSSAGTHNHFHWRDSLMTTATRLHWIQTIQFFTYSGQFTEEDIIKVISLDIPDRDPTIPIESQSNERVKWTWFMVHALLPLLFFRLLLSCIGGGIGYVVSKHAFKPNPNDGFFENLIEKIMAAGIENIEKNRSSGSSVLPDGSLLPMDSTKAAKATGPPKTLIFMYDIDVPETIWQECFPDGAHREIFSAKQCRGDEGEAIQKKINEGEIAIDKIVIAFDITEVPAMERLNFVRDTAGAVREKTFVLLSRTEALRRQMENKPSAIENRKMEWAVKLERISVRPEHIIDYFDHEMDDAKTRKRLAAFFRGEQEEFRLAGKYSKASEMILAGVQEIFDEYKKNPQMFASDQWDTRPIVDDRLISYREKITRLYAEEGKKLASVINRLASSVDVNEMKNIASEKMQQLGDQTLRESIAWGRWLNDVHKTLKPRCGLALVGIVPAAFVGVTLGTAAAALAGPLAALGIAGVAGGFFSPEVMKQLKKGGFRQEFLKTQATEATSSEAETNFQIEVSTFIASLTTWAVVHELQGLPPEKIAQRLSLILEPIETTVMDSPESIRKALAESRHILEDD